MLRVFSRGIYSLKIKLRLLLGSLDIGQRIRQKAIFNAFPSLSPHGKLILDAGCGSGASSLHLAHRYPYSQFVGIDSNMNRVEEAKTDQKILGIKNVRFVLADLMDPLGKVEYDIIFCIDVLEHIENDELAIKNLCSVLKLGGSLLIHIPLLNQKRHFGYFENWVQDDHVRNGYDEQHLIELLRSQNLRVVKKIYTFGWAGALAWETHEICRFFGRIAQIGCFPVLALVATLDLRLRNQKGNAILIRAMKESHHAD